MSVRDPDGLAVVLDCLSTDLATDRRQVEADVAAAQRTAIAVDSVEGRVRALAAAVGAPVPAARADVPISRRDAPPQQTQRWAELRASAELRIREKGRDPASLDLDSLLAGELVQRIERRFRGGFRIESHLDRYDVAVAAAAGCAAALVDFLVVRIPTDVLYLGQVQQHGSPLTKWLRSSFKAESDNWLAHRFKASFDTVAGVPIQGFSPRTHRLQSFGHDPLIGMVVGTFDVMRGGLTGIGSDGAISFLSGTGPGTYNPMAALVTVVGHQISDVLTPMGLPIPGWGLTQLLQVGSFGKRERTLAELARFMYLKGYDLRHLVTMATSVASAELILGLYFGIRQWRDPEFAEDIERERRLRGTKRYLFTPRYEAMSLLTHSIAAAANAGKIAASGGNPLALNIAQWVRFGAALFQFARTRMTSPTDVLLATARANQTDLDRGWPLPPPEDPGWPELVPAT